MNKNKNIIEKSNNYYGVFKLIYGKAINSTHHVSGAILDLVHNCKDRFLIEGVLAIMNKDLKKDQEIYYAARKFGLTPSVLMTLISVCS